MQLLPNFVPNRIIAKSGATAEDKSPAAGIINQSTQQELAQQKVVQADGYQYEASYWYHKTDVYVKFHCYPAR